MVPSCLSAIFLSKSSIQASAGPLFSLLADCMMFLIFPGWVAARDMAPGGYDHRQLLGGIGQESKAQAFPASSGLDDESVPALNDSLDGI